MAAENGGQGEYPEVETLPHVLYASVLLSEGAPSRYGWLHCSRAPIHPMPRRLLMTLNRCVDCGYYHRVVDQPDIIPCVTGTDRHPLMVLEYTMRIAHTRCGFNEDLTEEKRGN